MKKPIIPKRKILSIHHIKLNSLGVFLFAAFIIYLAGSYFGGIMLFLFYCFVMLPLLSFIHLLFAIRGIKFYQYFSTEHPVKGETIEYRLSLSNESPFSISQICSTFVTINPLMSGMMPDFRLTLKRGQRKEFTYKINCSYRGVYQVGLESVQITDILNFFTVNTGVWHRTFYVYPRIIPLSYFKFGIESFMIRGTDRACSGITDNTLIKGIREYRRADPVRHMYWKKFASTGQPVLKDYDISTSPEVSIYIDLYNEEKEQKTIDILEREDVSVEILTAIAKYYLEKQVRVTVRCPCNPLFDFKGYLKDNFKDFYKQTINLFSHQQDNFFHLFKVDMKNGILESKSVIFITHQLNPDLFNFVEESIKSNLRVMVIFNHATHSGEVQRKNKYFFNTLRDKGAHIIDVHSSLTIAEDLQNDGTINEQ